MLIDTGLVGEIPRLGRLLSELNLSWSNIKAILLTHGHLDHTGNLARLKELTGALVLARPLEQSHIDGTFPYKPGSGQDIGSMLHYSQSLQRPGRRITPQEV